MNSGSHSSSPPGEDEPVGRGRLAQRPGAQLAVLEHLGVAEHDLGAGGPGHAQPEPAHEVLPEVEDGLARGRRDHLDDGELFEPTDERRDPRLGHDDRVLLGRRRSSADSS